MKLQNAVSALVGWRLNHSMLELWNVFGVVEFSVPSCLNIGRLTTHSCMCRMTQLAKIDSRLCVYVIAVTFLHVAWKSVRHGLNDQLIDVLATICGQFINTQRYPHCCRPTITLSLNTAAKLMKVVVNKSPSIMSLIEIELSKSYLYRALRCKDSDSDSICCLANVYLEVLYYTTGQYQTAIDHCTLVTRLQDHSQCSLHVVQGEVLPRLDDDVDNALGLAVLYQHVRTTVLTQRHQVQHVTVFTTELFAYYVHTKYLSVAKCNQLTKPLINVKNCSLTKC